MMYNVHVYTQCGTEAAQLDHIIHTYQDKAWQVSQPDKQVNSN